MYIEREREKEARVLRENLIAEIDEHAIKSEVPCRTVLCICV